MSLGPWLSVAAASLLGSVHCAAMCGGFVAAYAGDSNQSAPARAVAHLAYNSGRLVTYIALGAIAGGVGHALDLAGRAAGLGHVAAVVTAVFLLLSGAWGLRKRSALVRLKARPKWSLASRLSAVLARFRSQPAPIRAGVLGLSSTLLPCGWLYAFAAFAAASGSPSSGAWLMVAFWLGSLPMMLGVGLSVQGIARRFERVLPRWRSAFVLAVGIVTLLSRLQLPAFAAAKLAKPAATDVHVPTRADCACHRKHADAPPTHVAPAPTQSLPGAS